MTQKISNNGRALLVGNILAGDTALTVEAGKADSFPVANTTDHLTPNDWYKAALEDSSGNIEIVHVGTRASGSGVMSVILRGQDGTTAKAFTAGAVVEQRVTAADIESAVNALTTSLQKSGGTMTGPLVLAANAAAAMQAVPKQQLDASSSAVASAANTALTAQVAALTAYIDAAVAAATPPSAVAAFARSTAPTGWLIADGGAVSRATYAALYAAIGIQFGAGNGSTTFNLPDLRGEFVRGWDQGRGVDHPRAFGTVQTSANLAHTHPQQANTVIQGATALASGSDFGISIGGTTASTGDSESRPRNIAFLYCIKT